MVNASASQRLGRELNSARQTSKRSLREVATSAEISAAYLQKLERGQVNEPSPKILRRLADALHLDYSTLMRLAGYSSSTEVKSGHPLGARLADADLTTAEERAVAAFVDHLVAQRETRA